MTAILFASFHLHELITNQLIEDNRYQTAISQMVSLAGRIGTRDLFDQTDELQRKIQHVTVYSPDVKQLDVYYSAPEGLRLIASTSLDAPRLPVLDEHAQDNELGEMERPLPDVVSQETMLNGRLHWLISTNIKGRERNGFVTALILKNPENALVSQLQRQHNLVLAGGIIISVLIVNLSFIYFFRRPARDIVQAMSRARAGDLAARSAVRRDDELGEIARGFNRMLDELAEHDREREQLLGQISSFNEELRKQVESATGKLRQANENLLQTQQRLARYERLATIGQVAASLAHEIGTPLNAVFGHLQLLGEKFPRDGETQRRVGIIHKQLESIVGIVRNLLQRTHKRRTTMKPTDLNELVRELLQLTKPSLDAQAISVRLALAPTLPKVMADADSLQQVFLNLMNNSVDAMPGGGTIKITTECVNNAQAAELLFIDSGKGITPAALDHLFEPLWTTKDVGSGFGLAIAREIMNEHGGKIEVVKEQTEGAAFRLTLPLMPVIVVPDASTIHGEEVLSHVI